MEKLFRIKKEAVQFFDKKYATKSYRSATWYDAGIHSNALEEVEKINIVYGIKKSDCGSDLSSWSDGTTKVHFTIEIRGEDYKQNDKTIDEINIRDLMNRFQDTLNEIYKL